jgi:hypothetical protein
LRYGGEDALAEVYAEMSGWTVHADQEIRVRHLRPAGTCDAGWRAAIPGGQTRLSLGLPSAIQFNETILHPFYLLSDGFFPVYAVIAIN